MTHRLPGEREKLRSLIRLYSITTIHSRHLSVAYLLSIETTAHLFGDDCGNICLLEVEKRSNNGDNEISISERGWRDQ